MANEPAPNGGENPNTPPKDGEPSGGTNPNKNGSAEGVFDPTKLSDEQLNKVLEDPRIWEKERIKQLREDSKLLKERQKKDEEVEKKHLEEQGKFKELHEKTQKELESVTKRADDLELKSQIMNLAFGKGIKDVDAAVKLMDSSKITRAEDGTFTGLTEAIETLVTERPYLVNGSTTVGDPSNPGNPSSTPGKFTMSQIGDTKFYQENRVAIQKAQAEGNIIEDRNIFGTQPKA